MRFILLVSLSLGCGGPDPEPDPTEESDTDTDADTDADSDADADTDTDAFPSGTVYGRWQSLPATTEAGLVLLEMSGRCASRMRVGFGLPRSPNSRL